MGGRDSSARCSIGLNAIELESLVNGECSGRAMAYCERVGKWLSAAGVQGWKV